MDKTFFVENEFDSLWLVPCKMLISAVEIFNRRPLLKTHWSFPQHTFGDTRTRFYIQFWVACCQNSPRPLKEILKFLIFTRDETMLMPKVANFLEHKKIIAPNKWVQSFRHFFPKVPFWRPCYKMLVSRKLFISFGYVVFLEVLDTCFKKSFRPNL